MNLDIETIRVKIENQEEGYYAEISFDVVIECLDRDTNRYIVLKTFNETVSGGYYRNE